MPPYTSYYEMMISLTRAIDLVNFLLKNHHRRVAVLSYHIGKAYHLDDEALANLVMAAALHDVGALTVAERNDLVHLDVETPEPHAILGAAMLSGLPHFDHIANIIRHHHRYYSDDGLYQNVPIESYILHLADRIEIMYNHQLHPLSQTKGIVDTLDHLTHTVFHPQVMDAFKKCALTEVFWLDLEHMQLDHVLHLALTEIDPIALTLPVLEGLALTFSKVIDYRSPYTATHSQGVGILAYTLAKKAGYDEKKATYLKIAGYLHDIGKIGIPTEILEKDSELTEEEFSDIKAHSYYTNFILSEIPGIAEIAYWASSHHEKRDGTGYPYKLSGDTLTLETDILAFADLFTALSEARPYRSPMDKKSILTIIKRDLVTRDNIDLFTMIESNFETYDSIRSLVQQQAYTAYREALNATLH